MASMFGGKIISGGDLSLAGGITSSVVPMSHGDAFAAVAVWSGGAAVGTIQFQGSVDGGTNWVNIPTGGSISATSIAVSGASGSAMINVPDLAISMIRAVYTRTSGAGTLDLSVHVKSYGN